MGSRALRIMLLLFEALWLNAIVPGHQRGIVKVPGYACPACEARAHRSCHGTTGKRPGDGDRSGSKDPAEHCAICHFAALLMVPTAPDLRLPHLGLLEYLAIPPADQTASVQFSPTYFGRAPPACDSFVA